MRQIYNEQQILQKVPDIASMDELALPDDPISAAATSPIGLGQYMGGTGCSIGWMLPYRAYKPIH